MNRYRIPYFEALASILSYYLALVCMFNNNIFELLPEIYGQLGKIGSETFFALVFFFAATIKVIGLIMNSHILRKIGLGLSALIYLVITVSYALSSIPLNWGTGIFFLLFAFCILSMFEIKHTKLI